VQWHVIITHLFDMPICNCSDIQPYGGQELEKGGNQKKPENN
jgi:hypothetical protein